MADGRTSTKRWGPRFSVRTLTVGITLLGLYFGMWELTKAGAKAQVDLDRLDDTPLSPSIWVPVESGSPCPCLIWVEEAPWPDSFYLSAESWSTTTYYFWFFGFQVRILGPGSYTTISSDNIDEDPFSEDPFAESLQ